MKKIVSLLLCAVMIISVCALSACGEKGNGAVIPVYISSPISSFDPAVSLTDENALKVIGLIYEGLTEISTSGKTEKALLDSWKYTADEESGEYVLELTIKTTQWSDARNVTADDFVYAWKRIMDPEFQSEAGALLMDLKNAKEVKSGDVSIDDLGVCSADTNVIQVTFSHNIDPEEFLTVCASPALYPLREDIVSKANDWSTNTTILVTNGPFTVRTFRPEYNTLTGEDKALILERNIYYYRNIEKDAIDKYVTAYRLTTDWTLSAEEQLEKYNNGEVLYMSELPLSARAEYKDKAKTQDTFSTHTYFFNTKHAPFDDPDVRLGLSMAIDRQAIADIVTFGKPAEGFVPSGAAKVDGKDFRDTNGNLITYDLEQAKSLVKGAKTKTFTILTRDNETDQAVAEYCAEQWNSLGFNIKVKSLGTKCYIENDYALYRDRFNEAYESGDFDVIAIDWQTLSTDAWSTLAPFAKDYSGSALDLAEAAKTGNFDSVPHITGYNSDEYNAIIDRAFAETDHGVRAKILLEAEQLLAKDMPVMPLYVHQDYYIMSKELSHSGKFTSYWGYRIFDKLDWKKYVEPVKD